MKKKIHIREDKEKNNYCVLSVGVDGIVWIISNFM